jgi:hypothetical protein
MLLLKHGARTSYINNTGFSAIDVARKTHHFECAEIIETSIRVQQRPVQEVSIPLAFSQTRLMHSLAVHA